MKKNLFIAALVAWLGLFAAQDSFAQDRGGHGKRHQKENRSYHKGQAKGHKKMHYEGAYRKRGHHQHPPMAYQRHKKHYYGRPVYRNHYYIVPPRPVYRAPVISINIPLPPLPRVH